MKSNLAKYIIEIVVITLSILAAFGLESWREDSQEKQRGKEALVIIREELIKNYGVLEYNINNLRDFNEELRVRDFLNGAQPLDFSDSSSEADLAELDSIKNIYLKNYRIQRMNPRWVFEDIRIDFLLNEFSFGMWESSKNSGVLIGIDPRTLSMLSSIYNSFQKDFGYSEKDYHKALITPGYYQQYSSTLKVADATVILEQSLSIKKLYIVDKRYEEVISHLDQKIGDK